MKVGFFEIVLICVVALIAFGPDKFPKLANSLGKTLRELKEVSGELTKDIKENIVEPLGEVQQPIKEAVAPLTSIKDEIDSSIKEVKNTFNDTAKTQSNLVKTTNETINTAEAVREEI